MTLAPDRQEELRAIHLRGDRLMRLFLAAHLVIALGMSTVYETYFVTVTVGLCTVAMFYVSAWLSPGSFLTRATAGIALQTFTALHIYQLHGMAEMHFWFFTASTMMIVYQDPKAMWPGTVLIILQHILFAVLHNSGAYTQFYEISSVTAFRLFFHFGIAIVQVAITSYWAYLLKSWTLREFDRRAAMARYAEELEAAKAAAERATWAKSRFLATMSHEIRTPMNGVLGATYLLADSELDEDQSTCLEIVRGSANALLHIIDDILDFSKIEAGALQLDDASFDLEATACEVARLMALNAVQRDLEFGFSFDPRIPSRVFGDAGRVRQILLNLCSNALKFTEAGHVELAARLVGRRGDVAEVEISVQDTGVGISEAGRAQLFTEFSQVDGGADRRHGGTGLGLAICKRLVDRMGGQIGVDSALGEGSRFWLRVPLPVRRERAPLGVRPSVHLDVAAARLDDNLRDLLRALDVPLVDADVADVVLSDRADGPKTVRLLLAGRRGSGAGRVLHHPLRIRDVLGALDARALPTPESAPTETQNLSSLSVLVVEDNAVNRHVAGRLLMRDGVDVAFADNGQEAVDAVANQRFDCVLMDIQMPVMDGFEATRQIRARGDAVPIIALTANASPEERAEAKASGMTDFLTKPFQPEQLKAALQRWCRGARSAA